MGSISDVRAIYGLVGTGTPSGTNLSGTWQVGVPQTQIRLDDATIGYSMRGIIFAAGSEIALNVATGSTAGSDAFVAGTAQVETATASGTITLSGNASITVTSAGMTGSPKLVSVAVTNGDTADVWAGKVRTALAADVDISGRFSVGGAADSIVLTRLKTSTFAGPESVDVYPDNDGSLNIAIANGTCTGITAAPTSTNTTAGVATSGSKIYDGDGNDFEGVALAAMNYIRGAMIQSSTASDGGVVMIATGYELAVNPGETIQFCSSMDGSAFPPELVCSSDTGIIDFTITAFGTP